MHERAAARLRGCHTGRPARLTPAQVRQVRALRDGGETIPDLTTGYGVSRATTYRGLAATTPPDSPGLCQRYLIRAGGALTP